MKSVGEILTELGFNKDAPLETQKAFVRHLIKQAETLKPIPQPEATAEKTVTDSNPQLSFDPKILGLIAK
jgi:hypothetical protein